MCFDDGNHCLYTYKENVAQNNLHFECINTITIAISFQENPQINISTTNF